MGKTIGIDLGTTNTAVSTVIDGRPQMVKNKRGYSLFPSAIYLDDRDRIITGQRARTASILEPQRGAYAVKRLLGLRYDSEEVKKMIGRVDFKILPADDGTCLIDLQSRVFSPLEISSLVLAEAKKIAEESLGEEISDAVITVPAHFNHAQRSATKRAADLAGLPCMRIINEPTAAALAYGFNKQIDRIVLVYDLGGGTFDVSLLQYGVGVVETLSTRGDTLLGGEDFDDRILQHLKERVVQDLGCDPSEDMVAMRRLKDAGEKAKCDLSAQDFAQISIPQLIDGNDFDYRLTRSAMEELVDDLVQRTMEVMHEAIQDAGITTSKVDEVILVGGQSRMPRIHALLTETFGTKPSRGIHPDEAVAMGAGVHASALAGEGGQSAQLLLDVTPFDLGIDISGGLFERLIQRNSHVPTIASKRFITARVDQERIRIVVRQGESRIAHENEFLGEFTMTGMKPGPSGASSVDVTFRIDSNGMLHVTALETLTGEKAHITVRNYGEYAKAGDKVSLDVDSRSVVIEKAEALFHMETIPEAEEGIRKKVGFFQKLFGDTEAQQEPSGPSIADDEGTDLLPLQMIESVEVDLDEEGDLEGLDFLTLDPEELFLEDDASPAQLGMADSSDAVSGTQIEAESETGSAAQESEMVQLSDILVDTLVEESMEPEADPELSSIDAILSDMLADDDDDESDEISFDLSDLGLELDNLLDDSAGKIDLDIPDMEDLGDDEEEIDISWLTEDLEIQVKMEEEQEEPSQVEEAEVETEISFDIEIDLEGYSDLATDESEPEMTVPDIVVDVEPAIAFEFEEEGHPATVEPEIPGIRTNEILIEVEEEPKLESSKEQSEDFIASFEASPLDSFISYKDESPIFEVPEDDFFSSLERVVSRVKRKAKESAPSREQELVQVIEIEEEEEEELYFEEDVPEEYRFLEALFDD
jgi:molecular chaperone DnaK